MSGNDGKKSEGLIIHPVGTRTESEVIGCQTCNRPLIEISDPKGWRQLAECLMICRPCLDRQVVAAEKEVEDVREEV